MAEQLTPTPLARVLMSDNDLLTIHTDGAARGNPGPAAFSFVLHRQGEPDIEDSGCLGDTTNNVAEYTALVKALERARQVGAKRLAIHSDSELMIKQMKGEYKVKHEGLRPLYDQARQLTSGFERVTFQHVRREQNKRADELCNLALDGGTSRPSATRPAATERMPAKPAQLPAGVRDEILDCLRSVAVAWSYGDPNQPRPEEVWEQLWTLLQESGILKSMRR